MRRTFINCITFGMSHILGVEESSVSPQITEPELLRLLTQENAVQMAFVAAIIQLDPNPGEDPDIKHLAVKINGIWQHRECSGADISNTSIAELQEFIRDRKKSKLSFFRK